MFSSFPLLLQIVISRFVSYIDNQHPRLQRLYEFFFLRMLGFYSHPSPQHICSLYSYFLQMEGSMAMKCPASTPVFLSLHTKTQITGRNLKILYHQFCKIHPFVLIGWCYLQFLPVSGGNQRSLLFTGLGKSGNLLALQRRSTVPQLF